ncbi:unnamed protein product [Linum trigynum]|uniref:Uncharacterized protein n=1 Tax=Linum trigynum TaxID=586398 RepID=A0AAV2EYY4_9ROSI
MMVPLWSLPKMDLEEILANRYLMDSVIVRVLNSTPRHSPNLAWAQVRRKVPCLGKKQWRRRHNHVVSSVAPAQH